METAPAPTAPGSEGLTFVTTCMGRLAHLRRSLPTWLAEPCREVVVVDYSCPDRSGEWAQRQDPRVRVVRVPGQARFNLSRARNAGLAAVRTSWTLVIDADVLARPGFVRKVEPLLTPGRFLWPSGGTFDLYGTKLVETEALRRVGGYDEVFDGWGPEDSDLRWRLERAGWTAGAFPASWLLPLPHGTELRTRHYAVQDIRAQGRVNSFYNWTKHAIVSFRGEELPLAERQELHARVAAELLEVPLDRPVTLEIPLGSRPFPEGFTGDGTLTLRMRPASLLRRQVRALRSLEWLRWRLAELARARALRRLGIPTDAAP